MDQAKKKYYLDVIERVGWTAIETGLAVLIDQLSTGTVSWRAIVYAVLLALSKTIAARHIGDSGTAAIEPPIPEKLMASKE